jgi:RNA polymerase-binding protein DksA
LTTRTRNTTTAKKTKKKTVTKKVASRKKTATKAGALSGAKKVVKKAAPKKKSTAKATTKKVVTKAASKKVASSKTTKAAAATAKKNGVTPARRRRRQTVVEAVVAAEVGKDGYVIINGRHIRRIAVDASLTTKRRAAKAAAKADPVAKAKKLKSPLSRKELNAFKKLLLDKRREVMHALDSMETQALRNNSGESSSMPIHMADVGSDAYDQDLKLGLSASERERVKDIDAALVRIAEKTYGVCESTGEAIVMARLHAKPWARFSIAAARKLEPRRRR